MDADMGVGDKLHEAVRMGCVSTIKKLLSENVDINARDSAGNTPLLLAICIKDEVTYNIVVETLIENGADVNISNKGFSPLFNATFYQRKKSVDMLLKAGAWLRPDEEKLLHWLAEKGCCEILDLFLNDKRCTLDTINAADLNGQTPVYKAVQNCHKDCVKMLIQNGVDLSYTNTEGQSVIGAIFEEMDRPVELMVSILDSKIALKKTKEKNFYFVDFSVLAPKGCKRQMDVISCMLAAASDEEKIDLLQHPVIELYLHLKWTKIAQFFYFWIAIYCIFVCSLTTYVMLLIHKYEYFEAVCILAKWSSLVTATGLLGHAILQFVLSHGRYIKKYEYWINLASTFLSLIVTIVTQTSVKLSDMPNWVLHVTSVAILLAWSELMLLIGRLPTYGYYALMFSTVLQNVIKVLLAFICLLIGFALSFSVEFCGEHQFQDPWLALVKTMVMMTGELEYSVLLSTVKDESGKGRFTTIIFLMFIILTSIVLMNLMIGLAVSDIQALQKESHARKLEKQADFVANLEKVIGSTKLNSLSEYVPAFIRRLYHKKGFLDTTYELKMGPGNFRKKNKLPARLTDALIAKGKANKN